MALSVENLLPNFRTRFPELSGVSDDLVSVYIEDALCIFALCEKAVVYLAAHLCVLDRDQNVGVTDGDAGIDDGLGQIQSEKIGQKQAAYKHNAERDADTFYTSTPYGRKYLEFKRTCSSRAFKVRIFG